MREILFRAKAINRDEGYHRTKYKNGDWVYGLITRLYDERFKELPSEMTNTSGISGIEIDYKTVGQYTGLTDKNGRKIFTGDIVKYQFDNDDCPFPNKRTDKIIGRIFFSDFRASFSVTAGKNGSSSMNNDLFKYVRNGNRVEVIGNIHDNPELLKGGEEQ